MPTGPAPERAVQEPERAEIIAIRLGTWGLPKGKTFMFDGLRPEDFWPSVDEVPFPEGEDVDELVGALFSEYRDQEQRDRVLQLTKARRTDVLPEDPWEALLALEIERIHAEQDRTDAAMALMKQRAAEGRPDDYSGFEELLHDYGGLVELAEEAMEAWPDQPIAEYAALYKLYAHSHPYSTVRSAEEVAGTVMGVLRDSEDVIVRQGALTQLSNVATDVKLGPEDLDLLLEVYDSPDEKVSFRHAITVAAMESALASGDDGRARAWMDRHDDATDGECAPEVVAWRSGTEDWCRGTNQARDNRSSYLAARGVLEPVTWQAAVGAMVRRCHDDGNALGAEKLTASGTWSGEWSWSDWSAPSELASCVGLTPHEGPSPPEGARVELMVFEPLDPAAAAP